MVRQIPITPPVRTVTPVIDLSVKWSKTIERFNKIKPLPFTGKLMLLGLQDGNIL